MAFTTVSGARIHWRLQGLPSSRPLVLLHSIGTDLAIHDRVAPLLEPDFLVLKIDLRGHGASDATAGEYSLRLLGDDVLAVMDAAGMDRAIVCGTSLGAMVAMEMAGYAPERIDGLLLACTSPGMSPALWPERIATVRARGVAAVAEGWASRHFSPGFIAANPATAETMTRDLRSMDPEGYLGAAAAIRDMDVLSGLAGATMPATVVAGEQDTATPFAGHGDRIAAAMPHAEVRFLPTGHLACVERPDLFAACVRELAARCN